MKIGDIVEIIYNKEEYSWREIGSIGIITHPFGKYNWIVDIINPVTREKKDSDRLKEEQLRISTSDSFATVRMSTSASPFKVCISISAPLPACSIKIYFRLPVQYSLSIDICRFL